MDTQNLFSNKVEKEESKIKKFIAAGKDIDDKPLLFGLEKSNKSQLKYGTSHKRFEWISQGVVDLAFISSIDFSRLKGGWKVLPNICKSTKGFSRRAALFFNKNLTDIESIAIPNNARTSEVVLKIILKELHQIDSKFVKLSGPLSESLKKCDAVLLTGDQAVYEAEKNPFHIDLGEEWFDLTGLPLVYGFWIGNELTTEKNDYEKVLDSFNLGLENIPSIAEQEGEKKDYIHNYLSNTINYFLKDEEQAALDELYRFSFFYGFVDYIPDIIFAEVD